MLLYWKNTNNLQTIKTNVVFIEIQISEHGLFSHHMA